jgi:GMP synthase (glutamine-hydrolysing)
MTADERTAVVLRHLSFEDLGLLAPVLRRAGWTVSVREAPVDDLTDPGIEEADLLIVLGGPMGVYEADRHPFIRTELAILQRRLAQSRPTLGICLGSQLMAAALGARVFPGAAKEIGWGRVSLTPEGHRSVLGPLAEEEAVVLHWHGDTFDLPQGTVRLASSASYENQAFAIGRHGLALQFHIEADPTRLEDWLVGHAAELARAGIDVPGLRAAGHAAADRVPLQAERIFTAWLREIG